MQTSLNYRTNRDLFSNYYLKKHLDDTEAWDELSDEELREVRADIMELWEREKKTAPKRNESQLEEKFIRPMFRKLGIPFEVEESTSRTQRRPDYGFFESEDAARTAFQRREEGGDFYKDAIAVADAKRWGRPLDTRGGGEHKRDFENPSYQIHVYLQETPARWAVLTDGKKWRLYYGPTSHRLDSYYEIDLPTVLEKGGLDEFRYFYLFFRHEAFLEDSSGDCFLDDVYEKSNTFAQELGEDLQDNIYEAIKVLSEGFMQYPDNNLSEADLDVIHDSSLIYLYRLIFVLYAESEGRDLLDTNNEIYEDSYSLNTLKKEIAEELDSASPKYQSWQDNLWDRLDGLFKLIDQGSKSRGIPEEDLYIPAYNGGLFRTDPDEDDSTEAQFLSNHQVGDSYLARVIELLTRSQNGNDSGKIFVDYSSLDVRHLGSIYEGLLEYQLDIADEPLALDDGEYVPAGEDDEMVVGVGEVHLSTGSGDRKATGSYYTPEYVVEYIVDKTLGPLVDDIREDLAGQSGFGDGGFADEFADRIFELKVLDPAMGSGHFLTSAIDYLAREIIDAQEKQAAQQGIETVDEDQDINWARRQVAQRCIYGVDLNPLAVELAKVSLWLRTLAAEQPLAFLDHHLKTGNSLIGSDIETVLDNGDPDAGIEEGQLTLQQSFDRTRQQALEHVTDQFENLLDINNQTLDDIKEMETVYDEARDDPLYQHLIGMANVHTAEQFGIPVPDDAYERMAAALRDDSWKRIEKQEWYRSAQNMAASEQFFHWELEFPIAFYEQDGVRKTDGGFDAVIGNPPYVKRQTISSQDQINYYLKRYTSSTYNFDLYHIFTEKGSQLLNKTGFMGYILPSKFTTTETGKGLRQYLEQNSNICEFVDFETRQVFEGVTTYTCLLFLNNQEEDGIIYKRVGEQDISKIENYETHETTIADSRSGIGWNISPNKIDISDAGPKLEQFGEIITGVETGSHDVLVLEPEDKEYDEFSEYCGEIIRNALKGDSVDQYLIHRGDYRIIVPYHENRELMDISYIQENFPEVHDYLQSNKNKLESREDGKMVGDSWYGYVYPKNLHRYEPKRIVWPDIAKSAEFAVDDSGSWHMRTVCSLTLNQDTNLSEVALISILNSNLFTWFIKNVSNEVRGGYLRFKPQYVEQFPIASINFSTTDSKRLEKVSDLMDRYGQYLEDDELSPIPELRDVSHDFLTKLGNHMISYNKEYNALNLSLLDYLGISAEGLSDSEAGDTLEQLQMPVAGVADTPLSKTTEEFNNLRIEDVTFKNESGRLVMTVDISYKIAEDDPRETDRWGRLVESEFESYDAMAFVGLSEAEETLIREFVPVAVKKKNGFASFRQNATKTNTPLDRLKALTLPDIDQVNKGLEQYAGVRERANELNNKIEKTDALINEIVYNLYGLTDEEIEIVELTVRND